MRRATPLRVAPLLDDDVEWHIVGPVGIFPFCGYRRGKAAALDYLARLVPAMLSVRRFEPEEFVIEGDGVGMFSKVTAVQKDTGRVLTFHSANFLIFRDDKVVAMHAITDTFDMVEQVVGHRVDAYRKPEADLSPDVVMT